MRVRDVLERGLIIIPHTATHEEAATILYRHNVSGAPVLDETQRLVGMISEKDLFRALYPAYAEYYENPAHFLDYEAREANAKDVRRKPVTDFMARHVYTIGPDDPILKAGGLMLAKSIHRLPVVDRDGTLLGIVTREQIYRAILERHLKMP